MVAYWSLRPRLDWLIAATVGGAWWLLARYWWTSPLDGVTAESRRAVYEQVSNFGMAALDGLGPIGFGERTADERILRSSLVDRSAVLALVVAGAGSGRE